MRSLPSAREPSRRRLVFPPVENEAFSRARASPVALPAREGIIVLMRGERLRPVNRRAGDQSGPWRRHVRYAPTPTYDLSAMVAVPRVTRLTSGC
jgi:hypothetical protein